MYASIAIERAKRWRAHVIASASSAHVVSMWLGLAASGGSIMTIALGLHNYHEPQPWIMSWLPFGTTPVLMFATFLTAIVCHAKNRAWYEARYERFCDAMNLVGGFARNMAVHRGNGVLVAFRPVGLVASVFGIRYELRKQLPWIALARVHDAAWEWSAIKTRGAAAAGGQPYSLSFAEWEFTLGYFAFKCVVSYALQSWLERRDLRTFLAEHWEEDMELMRKMTKTETETVASNPGSPAVPRRGGGRRGRDGAGGEDADGDDDAPALEDAGSPPRSRGARRRLLTRTATAPH
jgi:hypothetical protein